MPKPKKIDDKPRFKDLYPAIAEYVSGWGWIELGRDEMNRSFVRALDGGGLVWEAPSTIQSAGKAFEALESALHKSIIQGG